MLPASRTIGQFLYRSGVISTQVRHVTVVKRKYRARQPNSSELHKNLLTKTSQIYEVVEHTECMKKKLVSVVLKEYVEGHGDAGDIIEVLPGTARYSLILPGLADYATPEAIAKAKDRPDGIVRKSFSSKYASTTIRIMRNRLFPLDMSQTVAWTLEPWHIRVALRKNGLLVPESAIKLPRDDIHGPSDEVFNKDLIVTITINGKDEAPCRLRIKSAKQAIASLLEESDKPWYLDEVDALVESQSALVKEMHEASLLKRESALERLRSKGL